MLHATNNRTIPPSPGKVCKLLGVGQVEPGDAADRDLLAGHVLGVVRVRLVRGHVLPHLKDAIFSVFCRKIYVRIISTKALKQQNEMK